ncbi:GNAT family N-acetyltransferase [Microbacterium sp. 22296]|uniref:GNAT family N-acetyltransferase n=1 Tax=Microbacterium sp. 22296 TaxID=3453903 RepID=UPI003F82AE77
MPPMPLPPWPATPPAHGGILLREVVDGDLDMVRELATDPYIAQTGTLPADATEQHARAWIAAQQSRHGEGAGFSFTMADAATGKAVGHCGLWTAELGAGRSSAGYVVAPSSRGRGYAADALIALTAFGATVPGLFRIGLYIEPWNAPSIRTAERAGYDREGLLRSYHRIGDRRRDMLLYGRVLHSG